VVGEIVKGWVVVGLSVVGLELAIVAVEGAIVVGFAAVGLVDGSAAVGLFDVAFVANPAVGCRDGLLDGVRVGDTVGLTCPAAVLHWQFTSMAQLHTPNFSSNSVPAGHVKVAVDSPETHCRKPVQLFIAYNPVAPNGHTWQGEVTSVGISVAGCTGFLVGEFVGGRP
jgi:hypothetical protein